MLNKFTVNTDHFDNKQAKMAYIFAQTKGDT